jgi:hypothetical protein
MGGDRGFLHRDMDNALPTWRYSEKSYYDHRRKRVLSDTVPGR